MAGKVVNSSFLLLSKFGASRQESTSKTATSHIRKPLCVILKTPESMFGLFKKKEKKVKQPRISEIVEHALSKGQKGLHINLYIEDQILFQVVPARSYGKRGLSDDELNGFVELHFFNKNKTLTNENEAFAKKLVEKNILTHYEEPKGNHNYISAVGNNPEKIERLINKRIDEVYQNIDRNRISIEYVVY